MYKNNSLQQYAGLSMDTIVVEKITNISMVQLK